MFINKCEFVQPVGNNTKPFSSKEEKKSLRFKEGRAPLAFRAFPENQLHRQKKKKAALKHASSFLRARARRV